MAARKRDYYNYSTNYYNNSSSALEAYPLEEKPVRKPKKVKYRGTRTVTEDATDKSVRPSPLILVAMAFIAACAFLSILVNSHVTLQSAENNRMRSELQTMQMRTSELNTLIATGVDMEEVERIARTRLGMGEPQIHQIRHIYVPRQNVMPGLSEMGLADASGELDGADIENDYILAGSSIFANVLNIFARD